MSAWDELDRAALPHVQAQMPPGWKVTLLETRPERWKANFYSLRFAGPCGTAEGLLEAVARVEAEAELAAQAGLLECES